jgi:hypothetical protein
MIQEYKKIPEPLQKQIIVRIGLAALSLTILVVMIIATGDALLWLPCAASAIFFAAAALGLFRRAVLGEYVVITGECIESGMTIAKRRCKYILLRTDACRLKVMLRNRRKKIPVGAALSIYVAKNAPIYDQNDLSVLYNYLAIDILAEKQGMKP